MTATAAIIEEGHISYFSSAPSGAVDPEQESIVRDVKVFRTGTFRDSKGRQHTYTEADLDKMVANYTTLRDLGSLRDVPVRADHSESINDVVGYFAGLRREGDYLLADIEFTEPDALAKWNRKTYRGRSLEVAPYRTNDEKIYAPCVLGLAFVDMPAIEGLYSRERGGAPEPIKESSTVPENDPKQPEPVTFKLKGVPTSDAEAIQSHIDALEKRPESPAEPATFRIDGADTTDVAAVQKHVTVLETFRAGIIEQGRVDFVKKLAEDGKIAAPQIDQMTEFAKSLDPEGFDKFRASYDGAPKAALFGAHGEGGKTDPPAADATEEEILEETVKQFRRGGMAEAKIAETDAFKRLSVLKSK